jgi:hypothetical protein
MNSYANSICCRFIPILNLISSNYTQKDSIETEKKIKGKKKAENENNSRWSYITRMNSDVDSFYLFLFLIKKWFSVL